MCKEIPVSKVLDACGLTCPLPLLKAKQALNGLNSGESLQVIATDPGSVRDFRTFAELSGNQLANFSERDGQYFYILIKT